MIRGFIRGIWFPNLFLLPIKEKEKESEVTQSCLTLCDPMDCSLPGSSVHGIFQAIVLEWIAISFSRVSSQPRARTRVSHIVDRRFTVWATREVKSLRDHFNFYMIPLKQPSWEILESVLWAINIITEVSFGTKVSILYWKLTEQSN